MKTERPAGKRATTLLLDTVTRAGERTNAGTRRRNGEGSLCGRNGNKRNLITTIAATSDSLNINRVGGR